MWLAGIMQHCTIVAEIFFLTEILAFLVNSCPGRINEHDTVLEKAAGQTDIFKMRQIFQNESNMQFM